MVPTVTGGVLWVPFTLGQFSLATGTQLLRPRPPGPERIQLSPTPTPSVPSPADFPAEAGGGAVQGEGTASGGGCLRVCEQFKFRREISGDNPGPGWLSSTGNLELGDSCGPRGGAAAPSNRTERRERPEPTLASRGKDLTDGEPRKQRGWLTYSHHGGTLTRAFILVTNEPRCCCGFLVKS